MFTTNNGSGPGEVTPENGDGLDSSQVQPVKSTCQIATEIIAGLKRFAVLSPLPIVLCATTALPAIVAILWGVFK